MHFRLVVLSVALVGITLACSESPRGSDEGELFEVDPIGQTTEPVSLEGSFGFGNGSGTELLSLEPILDPQTVTSAICGEGKAIRVQYVRTQGALPETTHRQVAANFDSEGGQVFQVVGDVAVPNETCFLAADSMLTRSSGGVRPSVEAVCRQSDTESLQSVAGRRVERCANLGETGAGARVVVAQFATEGTSALAALALVEDTVILYHALPAESHDLGTSTWRVDDGGIFDPESIRMLFVAELPQGLAAAFLWAGAEGESDVLVVAKSTIHSSSAVTGYRYWSPF